MPYINRVGNSTVFYDRSKTTTINEILKYEFSNIYQEILDKEQKLQNETGWYGKGSMEKHLKYKSSIQKLEQDKKYQNYYLRKNQLESLDFTAVNSIYRDVNKKIAEEENEQEFKNIKKYLSDINCADKDFEYWAKYDRWELQQFVALLLSRNPKFLTKSYINDLEKSLIRINKKLDIIDQYHDLFNLVKDFFISSKIFDAKEYSQFWVVNSINWAREKDIQIPQHLYDSILKIHNKPKSKTKEELEQENQNLKNQITNLEKKLKIKEDQRIIKTLYKIIKGITKKHYPDKTTRISKIKSTFDLQGINISKRSLQDHIKEALEED
jgi:hypothetical protein